MKNNLIYYLLIALSIIFNSCSEEGIGKYTKISVVLKEVNAITTPTTDTTPDYTFSSDDAGAITYGGSCSSSTTLAISGNNTITLSSLSDGTYADCTIKVSKTISTENSEKKLSGSITITSFTVSSSGDIAATVGDSTAPIIAEVTAVTTPTYDKTPDYIFSSDEAGTITYGGSCSSSTTSATIGNNTITLATLSGGIYTDCTIQVTDSAGNGSNTITITSFTVSGLFVIVGESGLILRSTDNGSSWSNATSRTGDRLYGVISGNNTFVAVGTSTKVSRSIDNGTNWDNATHAGSNFNLGDVDFGNNTFVAVGAAGSIERSTNNGINWNAVVSGTGETLKGVTFGNNTFIAVGESGNILRSTDNGLSWDNATSPTAENLEGVTFGNNTFIAAGQDGNIVRSIDNGSSWDNATCTGGCTHTIWDIGFGNNTFVGVTHNGKALRSTDNGSNFNVVNVTGGALTDVSFGNNIFVIVGLTGRIFRSTDNGLNWNQMASGTSTHLRGVTF